MFQPFLLNTSSGSSLLAGNEADFLAIDFVDKWFADSNNKGMYGSISIRDTATPANNFEGAPKEKLVYSNPSLKMTMGPNGKYRYQSHNLYLNSESPANQSITTITGSTYAVIITGSVSMVASNATTGTWTAGTYNFTAGSTTLTLSSTSGTGRVHIRRTPSDSVYLATTGSINISLPYEWDINGTNIGIYSELARTNLYTNNTTLTGWNSTGITVNSTSESSPIQNLNFFKLEETSDTSIHGPRLSVSFTSGTIYTVSVILKASERNVMLILFPGGAFGSGAGGGAEIRLDTLAITNTGATTSSSVIDLGNGSYRFIATATATATAAASIEFRMRTTFGGGSSYTGTVGYGMFMTVPQLEAGTYASSPIITYASSVTRAVDNITMVTSLFNHNNSTGTFFMESLRGPDVTSDQYPGSLHDGTSDEMIRLQINSGNHNFGIVNGGVLEGSGNITTISANSLSRHAVAYELNNSIGVANGILGSIDTSVTMPTTTTLQIGGALNAGSLSSAHIRKILIVPRRVSDADLLTFGIIS
jgi:hypothetical protein